MPDVVLTVDDSVTIRRMLRLALEGQGFEVIEAGDGVEGLRQLEESRVRLIITDLNMPNMDGVEFIKQARAIDDHKFTPILVLTTESEDYRQTVRDAGATGWLSKPFEPEALMSAIRKVVPRD